MARHYPEHNDIASSEAVDPEMEISSEMLAAGRNAIYQHHGQLGDDGWALEDVAETVRDVYLAMIAVRQ
jgi:hypothetical protein